MAEPRPPMISVAEARDRVLSLTPTVGTELVALNAAHGRVLRADLTALRTQPPFNASAMDGYAVRAEDAVEGAALRLVGEIAAGATATRAIGPGETMRIFTGAPLPDGADGVLLQEDASAEGDIVTVRERVEPGVWIRPRGGDFASGEALLAAPRRLSASAIALAAAMGRPWLDVARRPRVALLTFGDELRLPGEPTGPSQIVASNAFGVAAMADRLGAETSVFQITSDDLDETRAAIRAAAAFDAIVTLGGASDGDHDLSRPAFAAEGATPDFYRIAMRPGKPLMASRLGDALVLGLPGNPVSAMVCARLFLAPAVLAMLGLAPGVERPIERRLAVDIGPNGPREHYMRAALERDPSGAPRVRPFDDQDSSLLSRLAAADTLAIRPPHDPARAAGEVLQCLDLDPPLGY